MRFYRAFLLVCLAVLSSAAGVPRLISYQGKLTDASGVAVDGTHILTFRIYDCETGGTALWSETHFGVEIHKGLFSVILGTETALNLPFDRQYWLEIAVDGEILHPRVKLTSVPYAIRATYADSVGGVSFDTLGAYWDTTNHFSNFTQDSINWDTLGAYWDTTNYFLTSDDLDTLGAYLDTTYKDSFSVGDSLEYVDSITYIGTVFTVGFVDSVGFIDSIGHIAHADYADSAGKLINSLVPGAGILGEAFDGSAPRTWSVNLSTLGDVDTAGINPGDVLKFSTGGLWRPSAVATSSDSGNYILNQDTVAQSANFWIDGLGMAKRLAVDTSALFPSSPRKGEFHTPTGTNELYWFDGEYWRRIVPPDSSYSAYGGPLSVTISYSDDSICAGTPITFHAEVSGGYEPYLYDWNIDGTGDWDDSATVVYSPPATQWVKVFVKDSLDSIAADSVQIFSDSCGSFRAIVGWVNDDYGYGVVGTAEGGAFVVGKTNSFGAGGYDLLLLKFDLNGNLQWAKTAGTSGNEWGFKAAKSSDGGYIVAGEDDSDNLLLITKLDSLGNVVWAKTIDEVGSYPRRIVNTSDGEFVILTDINILKISPSGDVRWITYHFKPDSGSCVLLDIAQTADNGFFVVGCNSISSNRQLGILIKFNEYGKFEWGKKYGYYSSSLVRCQFYRLSYSEDYVIVSGEYYNGGGHYRELVAKIDTSGNVLWADTLSVSSSSYGRVIRALDGEFYIPFGHYVYKISDSGSLSWCGDYGYTAYDAALSRDGGLLTVGYTSVSGRCYDVVVGKIQSDGSSCWATPLSVSMGSVTLTVSDFYPSPYYEENTESFIEGSFSPVDSCDCGACE